VIRKQYQENAIDLVANALEHEQIAEAVLTGKPGQVKRDGEKILAGFGKLYLSLTKSDT
jgi:hypothetical protein